MIQRVRNNIKITCECIDFSKGENMEIYVEQGKKTFVYPLLAETAHEASFVMPKADAMQLDATDALLQFAATIDGEPVVSIAETVPVLRLLNGDGYGN